MDISSAKSAFENILNCLNSKDRLSFLLWCEEKCTEANFSNSYVQLRMIAEDIKRMVPTEGILPSEIIDHSQIENVSSENKKPIMHIDSFLFEEEDIDVLEAEGKVKRNYCQKCGSLDVVPTIFVSHSLSIKRIQHIFQHLVPDLTGKIFLDVGSRLGAALYGAYYCSSAQKIIGVEMNEDLCKLQNHIIEKYNLNDRIQVICSNIVNVPNIIQYANVILFNNVFQCFLPVELQQNIWQWLKNTIIHGTVILTIPSIEETLSNLQTGIDISSWLRPFSNQSFSMEDSQNDDDPELLSEIFCYTVL